MKRDHYLAAMTFMAIVTAGVPVLIVLDMAGSTAVLALAFGCLALAAGDSARR